VGLARPAEQRQVRRADRVAVIVGGEPCQPVTERSVVGIGQSSDRGSQAGKVTDPVRCRQAGFRYCGCAFRAGPAGRVLRNHGTGGEFGVDQQYGGARTIGGDHLALRDQVLTELRRRIVDGEYAQGERLTENRLADDFGVSRNPVREALRVVEAEGFVQILPRRGAVVATLDETAIRDLFAVRERLETLAAGLAAERATEEDVARLRQLLEDASAATEAKDFDLVAELNSALHLTVIEISGNRWLASLSAAMYHHVHWVFRLGAAQRAPHSWKEHIRVVDAIAAGDADAASAAAREHVEAAAAAALKSS